MQDLQDEDRKAQILRRVFCVAQLERRQDLSLALIL